MTFDLEQRGEDPALEANFSTARDITDPSPVIYRPGSSRLFITMPHLGKELPSWLHIEPKWRNRHEFTDLGLDRLWPLLAKYLPQAHLLGTTYSRLAADANRVENEMVMLHSSEYDTEDIMMNLGVVLGTEEWQRRKDEIWQPYHDQKQKVIADIETEHGPAILLDVHSCAPKWENAPRNKLFGLLGYENLEDNDAARMIDAFMREHAGDLYEAGFPYPDFKESKTNAGQLYKNLNILEIVNTLLRTEDGTEKVAQLLKDLGETLLRANKPKAAANRQLSRIPQGEEAAIAL